MLRLLWSLQAVVVGRSRDLSDHSQWLMSQGKWAQALELQEHRPREITPEVQDQVRVRALGSASVWTPRRGRRLPAGCVACAPHVHLPNT